MGIVVLAGSRSVCRSRTKMVQSGWAGWAGWLAGWAEPPLYSYISLKNVYRYNEGLAQPSQPSPASQPSQPSPAQPRLYHFGSVATNRARPSQNYYTHGHPSPNICGGTFELRGQFGLRRGELEIGPNFGPLPAPCRPSLAPTGARLALVKVKPR